MFPTRALILIYLALFTFLFAQKEADSTQVDSTLRLGTDTLNLRMVYPVDRKLPVLHIPAHTRPKPGETVDYRGTSYYTPTIVQDKLDQIMNRPRADSFTPILPLAMLATKVAIEKLNAGDLFKLKAQDYIIADLPWDVLEKIWLQPNQSFKNIFEILNKKGIVVAGDLDTALELLSEKNLIKTKGLKASDTRYFPAQSIADVKLLFSKAFSDTTLPIAKRNTYLKRIKRLEKLEKKAHNK